MTPKPPVALVRGLQSTLIAVISAAVSALVLVALTRTSASSGHDAAVRSLLTTPTTPTLRDVGGYADVKRALHAAVITPLQHRAVFPDARPRVLLHGPPGTGKTTLARAVAVESSATLVAMNAATLESKWYGDSPRILAAAFAIARANAPCVLLFDEIDGLCRARTDGEAQHTYTLKCELLRHLDDAHGGVAVIACTNHASSLDAALRRRLERTIAVPPPDASARTSILRRLLRADAVDDDVVRRLVHATDGRTGADLKAACDAARERRVQSARVQRALARGVVRTPSDLATVAGPLRGVHFAPSVSV